MEFGLSEEQQLLEKSVRRFLDERAPIARVREIAEGELAFDTELWKGLAEIGVAGCLVPEDQGGTGLALLDAAIIAQSLGYFATPAPFVGSSVMATVALLAAGSPAQQAEWLPRIASGELRIGVGVSECVSPREGAGVAWVDGRLVGKALFVIDAGSAESFLVGVGPRDLCLVNRAADGLEVELLSTIDETRRIAELRFDAVEPAESLGERAAAGEAIARVLAAGRVVLAADTLGACDRAIEMAVAYAMERKQFGRVVGSFQAVKHMCAEMAAETEPTRSFLWYAAHAFDAVPDEAPKLACLLKARLSDIGTRVVRSATEVHGGIGFTAEHDLHLWFKRAGLNRQLLGGPTTLRRSAAQLAGLLSS